MEHTLFGVGVACVIAAIAGGGLKALGAEFPPLNSTRRQLLLGAFGLTLMGLSGYHPNAPETKSQPCAAAPTAPVPSPSNSMDSSRPDQPPRGYLVVTVDMPAEISIDGDIIGTTHVIGQTLHAGVTPGDHIVQAVTNDGVDTWKNTASVTAGNSSTISVDLTSAKAQRLNELVETYHGDWSSRSTTVQCADSQHPLCTGTCTFCAHPTLRCFDSDRRIGSYNS